MVTSRGIITYNGIIRALELINALGSVFMKFHSFIFSSWKRKRELWKREIGVGCGSGSSNLILEVEAEAQKNLALPHP